MVSACVFLNDITFVYPKDFLPKCKICRSPIPDLILENTEKNPELLIKNEKMDIWTVDHIIYTLCLAFLGLNNFGNQGARFFFLRFRKFFLKIWEGFFLKICEGFFFSRFGNDKPKSEDSISE